MDGFLTQVAADLYARYGDGVASLRTLFPSRRAALFFGEALSGIISRPLWQPASVTVDEVAAELSGLTVGDRLRLVTELFGIYREFHPKESFDTFYFWGELLLGDFDSIDKYLVDADTLFSNLVDLHEMDDRFDYLEPQQKAAIERFWGTFARPGGSEEAGVSPEQRDFLNVWRTLAPIYHRFRARLRELGIAYQGMVYREAAERIADGTAPVFADRRYVVAGFNALSRSEQAMFDHLRHTSHVDFYWDHDDYFTRDAGQEAGRFMRDNLRRFPPAGPLSGGHDNFRRPKTIRSVAAASDVLQCKYAGLALAEIARERGVGQNGRTAGDDGVERKGQEGAAAIGKETAVVLCDENLLVPLLWSMPPEVEGINITMGYPLRLHPAYTFVERLVELQNRRRDGRMPAFYHSDVEGLLRHPYLVAHVGRSQGQGANSGAGASVLPKNFVYISAARLRTTPLFEKIFASAGADWRGLSEWLTGVLSEVARVEPARAGLDVGDEVASTKGAGVGTAGVSAADRPIVDLVVEHIGRLANSLEGCGVELSTKTYAALLRRSLQSTTVPFEGEPLEGVQVMGILETRALDFENIVFLSADDDRMPGSLVGAPSFIPYNLKAAYGLPTPEHHEGVWAYHFFRLMGRARRVDVVWSRTTDDRSAGMPSRYLLQLDYESPHEVAKRSVAVDVNLSPTGPIVVEKRDEVMARLGEFLLGGEHDGERDESRDDEPRRLSPSLFYTYVECPLKFYFRGVARLRPAEEVAEEVDGALLGNILHRAMQLLYEPLVGAADPREGIRSLIRSEAVGEAARRAVAELYPWAEGSGAEDWGGGIVLAHKTIVDYIDRCILPYDARSKEPFTIEGLERQVAGEVDFGAGRVVFGGIADRIDRLPGGYLRVVDYKTGNPRNDASARLQMGLYAMMLGDGAQTALYFVRDMTKSGRNADGELSGVIKGDNDSKEEFYATLQSTLSELFDPAVPFTQCDDPKRCEWCDFRVVCRR